MNYSVFFCSIFYHVCLKPANLSYLSNNKDMSSVYYYWVNKILSYTLLKLKGGKLNSFIIFIKRCSDQVGLSSGDLCVFLSGSI